LPADPRAGAWSAPRHKHNKTLRDYSLRILAGNAFLKRKKPRVVEILLPDPAWRATQRGSGGALWIRATIPACDLLGQLPALRHSLSHHDAALFFFKKVWKAKGPAGVH